MAGELASAFVRVRPDTSGFKGELERGVRSGFGGIGRIIAGGVAGGIGALATLGVMSARSAIQFESSFAGIRKTVDATEPQFEALQRGIRNMAKEIPASVNQLNAIGESAGQLGVSRKAILPFIRTIADLGETTNLVGEVAASSLAKIANVTRMPQSEFRRLGSTIVALGNAGASTEADITGFGLRIAGAGKIAGLTVPQILGIGNAFSSVGIEAEAGGTAVSKVLLNMNTAVLGGGKQLEQFAKVAGMTAQQFKTEFKDNAGEAFSSFVEGIQRITDSGGNAAKVLADLGLSDQRLLRAFLGAAGAGDILRESMELGTKAWKENTALTVEAEKRYKTTAAQLGILRNRWTDLKITIGEKMLPVINDAIKGIVRLAERVGAAATVRAKLNVIWEGVQQAGQALGQRLRDAVDAIDWESVGTKVGTSIVTGISASLDAAPELSMKFIELLDSVMSGIDWDSQGTKMGPGLASAIVSAFATLLDPGFWLSHWEEALAIGLAVFPFGRLLSLGGKLVEFLVRPLAGLGGRLGTLIGDAVLGLAGKLGNTLGGLFLDALVLAQRGLTAGVALIGSALGRIVGFIDEKLSGFRGFIARVLSLDAAIRTVSEGVRAIIGWFQQMWTEIELLALRGVVQILRPLAAIPDPFSDRFREAKDNAERAISQITLTKMIRKINSESVEITPAGRRGGESYKTGFAQANIGPFVTGKLRTALIEASVAGISQATGGGVQIGGAMGAGIAAGISAQTMNIVGAVSAVVHKAIFAGSKAARAGSPSKETEEKIGQPLGEGVIRGWVLGTADLPTKMKESLRKAIDQAIGIVTASRERFATAFQAMTDRILRAFDAQTSGHETATQALLREQDERRTMEDLLTRQADAQTKLNEAITAGDAAAIAAAQRDLARATEDVGRPALERQAEQERIQYESSREELRLALEARLDVLEKHWAKVGVKSQKALNQLNNLLMKVGLTSFEATGQQLGNAFVTAMLNSIRVAVSKGGTIANALDAAIASVTAGTVPKIAAGTLPPGALAAPALVPVLQSIDQTLTEIRNEAVQQTELAENPVPVVVEAPAGAFRDPDQIAQGALR